MSRADHVFPSSRDPIMFLASLEKTWSRVRDVRGTEREESGAGSDRKHELTFEQPPWLAAALRNNR
ncbi:hypothetical protein HBH64_124090 [Parastagonospora nodorum]|nr:hypothetical protein HBI01_195390 [Parastagonospora nodorum]KAH4317892.1 hypothetical protein HBI02_019560 [Parastagonospora nodorum]KAH4327090.1 hypothetical protein HBI00_136050 [Parastagonospora nodorum]KAH4393145.1 hypothetical protein HBH94_008000 [Parastagonospora nodorum]KAH4477114.1 hypothetical protein HBH90_004670 [Parastagonospora nodorum]